MTANWALGFMSGTSFDGVDAAFLKSDGETVVALGPSAYRPYADLERASLRRALDEAAAIGAAAPDLVAYRSAEAGSAAIQTANDIVTEAHIQVARDLLSQSDAPPVSVLGMHGQTIWHDPSRRVTRQIGDAQRLADAVGVDVVADFRAADVAAGGQGAPFAPFFHFALARRIGATEPLAILNLGGVANVTWIDPSHPSPDADGALLAFDTGPASALLDDWMSARAGRAYDEDGAAAASGAVNADALARLLRHGFFTQPPPKSLDRNAFAVAAEGVRGLTVEDGAATLTEFTALTVAYAQPWFPSPPTRWLVCGGGRRNPSLMRAIAGRVQAPVEPIEAVGFDGDMIEAHAFAHLAVRAAQGRPLSAPGTTGVPGPMPGGVRVSARPRA